MLAKIKPTRLGIIAGVLAASLFGLVYFVILREPGSAFYPFAGLFFLGCPLLAGLIAARKVQAHRLKTFLASGTTVFGIAFALFLVVYVAAIQFERVSVELPGYCDGFDGSFDPPAQIGYTLPDQSLGILIAEDQETAVVARLGGDQPPFPTDVFIVSTSGNKVLQSLAFPNDVVSAAIQDGIVYIFNDKLGALFDAHTGRYIKRILTLDNYGGLSPTDRPFLLSNAPTGHWYMETSAVISSWAVDGTVVSRPHLSFNGIALGCFVSGSTHEVTRY